MARTAKSKSWVRKSVRHDYLTPDDFIQILLSYLGRDRFDIDVCCSRLNIPATVYFIEGKTDALEEFWKHPHNSLCWMNPPCGADLQKFCYKMLKEAEKGAEVWALLPQRFPDYYVKQFKDGTPGVMRQASFIYVIPEWTFEFGLPDGRTTGKAKSSWWLCYFGKNAAEVEYNFRVSDPYKNTKYEGVLLCPAR